MRRDVNSNQIVRCIYCGKKLYSGDSRLYMRCTKCEREKGIPSAASERVKYEVRK